MTSRRSMTGHAERLSRALQFVPGHVGGRVASAQPIRRRGGTLRSASVGAVAVPLVPPVFMSSARQYDGDTGHAEGDVTLDCSDFRDTYTVGAGDIVVCVAAGVGTGWGAPAGWDVLDSGTIGDLDWMASALQVTGTDSWIFTTPTLSPGWTYDTTDAGIHLMWFWRFTGTGTPVAACTEVSGVSLVAMPTPSGAWSAPNWQAVAMVKEPTYTGGGSVVTPTHVDYGWTMGDSGRFLKIYASDPPGGTGVPATGDVEDTEGPPADPWQFAPIALGFA